MENELDRLSTVTTGYKVTISQAVNVDKYPIPNNDDLLTKVSGGRLLQRSTLTMLINRWSSMKSCKLTTLIVAPQRPHDAARQSNYSTSSSYTHFYVGSMYDAICLKAAPPYTSSADSAFSFISTFTMHNHLLLGLPLFLLPCTSVPLFSSHAYTTSTYFPCDIPQ